MARRTASAPCRRRGRAPVARPTALAKCGQCMYVRLYVTLCEGMGGEARSRGAANAGRFADGFGVAVCGEAGSSPGASCAGARWWVSSCATAGAGATYPFADMSGAPIPTRVDCWDRPLAGWLALDAGEHQ